MSRTTRWRGSAVCTTTACTIQRLRRGGKPSSTHANATSRADGNRRAHRGGGKLPTECRQRGDLRNRLLLLGACRCCCRIIFLPLHLRLSFFILLSFVPRLAPRQEDGPIRPGTNLPQDDVVGEPGRSFTRRVHFFFVLFLNLDAETNNEQWSQSKDGAQLNEDFFPTLSTQLQFARSFRFNFLSLYLRRVGRCILHQYASHLLDVIML